MRRKIHEIIDAAKMGDIVILKQLLNVKEKINIDEKDNRFFSSYKLTALTVACINSHEKAVALLLAYGAKINLPNYGGKNALHFAAEHNRLEVMRLLLANEQGKEAIDNEAYNGGTPINIAADEGHTEMVRFLILNGAKIDAKYSPLLSGIRGQHLEVCRLLLADPEITKKIINKKSPSYFTPLHSAVMHGDRDIVLLLIRHGANVNDECLPLHEAINYHRKELLQVLLTAGAMVTQKTIDYAKRVANYDLNKDWKEKCDEIVIILENHLKEKLTTPLGKRKLDLFFPENKREENPRVHLVEEPVGPELVNDIFS